MTSLVASSGVVLANLAYLIGAVVLAFVGGMVVWWRYRKPKSVDANVESFSRGLRALAPEGTVEAIRREGSGLAGVQPRTPTGVRIEPPDEPSALPETPDDSSTHRSGVMEVDGGGGESVAGAEEASGERAGVESG